MNRRDFLAYGTTAATGIDIGAIALGGVSNGAKIPGANPSLPFKVIFDARFTASRGFGTGAAQLGCAIRPIVGDLTAP
jgi:hypothetical protein